MSLFNFFKKTPQAEPPQPPPVLFAMPIFNNGSTYRLNEVVETLKLHWGTDVYDIEGDDEAGAFNMDGQEVAIANIGQPIPAEDIEWGAKYAYNWPSALIDFSEHTGHAIVTILRGDASPLARFQVLAKVLSAVLISSDAIGIYQGSQSLLIPRKQYLTYAELLKEGGTPVMLWIYIGLRKNTQSNSAYTYGLKDFGKTELECVNSTLSLESLYDFLLDVAAYIIAGDVTLKHGETIGMSAEQKISIELSKGVAVEGQSLKLKI